MRETTRTILLVVALLAAGSLAQTARAAGVTTVKPWPGQNLVTEWLLSWQGSPQAPGGAVVLLATHNPADEARTIWTTVLLAVFRDQSTQHALTVVGQTTVRAVDDGHWLATSGSCYGRECDTVIYAVDGPAQTLTRVFRRTLDSYPAGLCGYTFLYRNILYTVRATVHDFSGYIFPRVVLGAHTCHS